MTKKIFIISSILFLIAGIYLFVQFFLFQEKPIIHENKTKDDLSVLSNKENSLDKKIERVIKEEVVTPLMDVSGNKILYFNQGNFLLSNLKGTVKSSIGAYPFNVLEEIKWSSDNNQAIIKDADKYYIFDISSLDAKPFKSDADNLIWGSKKDQVIYKFYDSNSQKRSLNIADSSGASWEEITEIPFRYAEIEVNSKDKKVALFSLPKASQETQLFIVDLLKKEKREIEKKYKGADYRWSPNGEKLLFSYTKDSGKTSLAILNINDESVSELNFPGLVDKCVWLSDSIGIYCANLTYSDTEVVLPDDWESGKISSSDTFWKIDTVKGEQKRILELNEINENVDATSLFMDKDEKILFFVDKKTNNLFRIKLEN